MSSTPAITVAIPVHNGARYLAHCLESVLAQTCENIEVIVSDNCSTDATSEIIQAAAARDSRVIYHRNEVNIGGARNQNQLVDMASAPLFKWAYYDDVLAPEMLETSVRVLEGAGSATVAAYPLVQLIGPEGELVGLHDDENLRLDDPRPDVRLYRVLRRIVAQVQFGLIRTDVLRQTRRALPRIGGEFVLPAELALRGPMVAVPYRFQAIRVHPGRYGGSRATEARWIDPTGGHAELFPYARSSSYMFEAIRAAPLTDAQRRRCALAVVAGWSLPRWRYLAGDIVRLPTDLAAVRKARQR